MRQLDDFCCLMMVSIPKASQLRVLMACPWEVLDQTSHTLLGRFLPRQQGKRHSRESTLSTLRVELKYLQNGSDVQGCKSAFPPSGDRNDFIQVPS